MTPKLLVTTSWDDGHKLDVRLARLLKKYGVQGTFYIAPRDREFPQSDLLTAAQTKALARDFEIGAHTMTHPVLTHVPLEEAREEIRSSRTYLQRLTKQPVRSFCYPRGAYTKQHVQIVRTAGFRTARTVERHCFTLGDNAFTLPTTIHCYRHWSDPLLIARAARWNPARVVRFYTDWEPLAKALFDEALKRNETEPVVFHLWGHSWEIDANNDWARLERVLAYVSKRANVRYCTNDEAFVAATKRRQRL